MNKLAIKEKKHTVHWSSTEDSSTHAWYKYFDKGYQGGYYKTASYYSRAVRRVKVYKSNH